ncbi:hypothetical protein Terro_3371 [Terriglobus roseus DSM 18391]|uniref:TonB-dependent transporter Oar-like beta-barrel domain-containing protein n=1 Tax=Terriglobus roseus (strain DSM 18391 / NRRL B-41598 / KBS 63) TaxID=926566 RepID=I3ZK20_TERRK|nr:TonB-dependent receptor [Terriglobus roseus]AFL89588.1 hypothetical protein Terro_3371 [Terriglobus roseus DSM 18391]
MLITDPSGAAIAGAPVRIFAGSDANGVPLQDVKTDSTGRVRLALPAGSYVLLADAPGFNTIQKSLVVDDTALPITLTLKLSVAVNAEQVAVQSDDAQLDSDGGLAVVLKGKTLDTLSDNPSTFQQQLQAMVGSGEDGQQPQFRIDGFSGGRFPPKASIREVRINQNGYSAQFDQRGNSIIDIFTKPGTDKLHGFLLVTGNADVFNARNPYITAQPPYHSTYIDGNLNGPLGKKTSFFVGGNRVDMENNAAVNAVVLDSSFNSAPLSQAIPNPQITNSLNVRIDRNLSTNNTFTVRYEFADTSQTNSGVGQLVLASQGVDANTKTNTLQVGNTTIVGSHVVFESRFQYLRTRLRQNAISSAPTLIVQGAFNGGGSPSQVSEDKQDNYELQEYLSVDRGKHFLRAGARYRLIRDRNSSTAGYNGAYIFSSLAAYQTTVRGQATGQTPAQIRAAGGGASQFNITAGTASAAILTGDLGLYVEDEWKVTRNFSLIPGLRFETQSGIPDHIDPAPRLGFSWAVTSAKRKSPYVSLRGGVGIFYDRFAAGNILTAARQNGVTQRSYYFANPDSYPNILSPSALAATQPTVYRISPTLRNEYYVSEGITASRPLFGHGNLSLTYNHIQGVHLLLSRNVNAPLNGVRPLGGTQNIYQFSSEGNSTINSLWTNYYVQFGNRAGLFGSYSLRFQQSNAGSGASSFPSNSYNIRADYGRPAQLARNRGYIGGWFNIPFGISGSMFLSAHSSTRFNITTGADNNGDSIYNDRPSFATDLTRASVVRTAYGNFDTAPIAGQQIIPINYGHGYNFFSLQTQFGKGFGFGKRPVTPPPPAAAVPKANTKEEKPERPYQLFLSVEAQNVLNHVNPGTPIGQLTSPYFGRSLTLNTEQGNSTAANRQISVFMNFRF